MDTELGKADLTPVVQALNSTTEPEVRDHLKRLIQAWERSGPRLQQMLQDTRTQDGLPLGQVLQELVRLVYRPQTSSGRAQVRLAIDLGFEKTARFFHRRDPEEARAELHAIQLFALLTLNPRCTDLGGPCARCNRFFVNRRRGQKYCSRQCHSRDTAVAKQTNDREIKLRRARAAIRNCPGNVDWKLWVARKSKVHIRFLTRAINNGSLRPPRRKGTKHAKT